MHDQVSAASKEQALSLRGVHLHAFEFRSGPSEVLGQSAGLHEGRGAFWPRWREFCELWLEIPGGLHQGCVSRAAAEVASDGIDGRFWVVARGVQQIARETDHETRRAESALGCAAFDHGALGRAEGLACVEPFNGDHMPPAHMAEEQHAGGDCPVTHPTRGALVQKFAEQHRAGAAVPFAATLLGAHRSPVSAQVVEQQPARCPTGFQGLGIELKAQGFGPILHRL